MNGLCDRRRATAALPVERCFHLNRNRANGRLGFRPSTRSSSPKECCALMQLDGNAPARRPGGERIGVLQPLFSSAWSTGPFTNYLRRRRCCRCRAPAQTCGTRRIVQRKRPQHAGHGRRRALTGKLRASLGQLLVVFSGQHRSWPHSQRAGTATFFDFEGVSCYQAAAKPAAVGSN
jgi:hypothetical protein